MGTIPEITIPEFYSGRQVFVTGGTGFMGKVLIEKMLRSLPGIDRIFVLLRSKRGFSPQERIINMTKLPLFELLHETNSKAVNKLTAIEGDVTQLGLGISAEDLALMRDVSVIFHVAASVRFDDPLQYAILLNTRGTREVLEFALTLENIESIVHVSTSYCYPDKHEVEEKLYPPYADWNIAIKAAERLDTEVLNILCPKFSSYQPNTYTFTKCLAEHVVNEYKDKLPLVIVRPSIVISAMSEPIPGWIDNFNGPVGLFVASGVGILRTMHGEPTVVSDFIPVDIVMKMIIIAAFKKGIETKEERQKSNELTIYNSCAATVRGLPTGKIITLAEKLIKRAPFNQMLWIPYGALTSSKTLHYLRFFFYHILVAIFVDTMMRLFKKQPFLLRIQRRIYAANLALYYFATTHWTFQNERMKTLDTTLPLQDVRDWQFLNQKDADIIEFFYRALMVVRRYILKEPDSTLPMAKRKFWTIYYVDWFIRIVVFMSAVYFIFTMFRLNRFVCPFMCTESYNQ